ncbi:MAG: hypothetical protein K2X80_04040, partial [Pseudomonadaceae bacterium]|nr:hypothetical protein [Pseudomonadaceae bacterium]
MSEFDQLGIRVDFDKRAATSGISQFQSDFSNLTRSLQQKSEAIRSAFASIKSTELRNKFFPSLAADARKGASEVQQNAQRIRIEIESINRAANRGSSFVSGFVGGLAGGLVVAATNQLRVLASGLTDASDSFALIEAKIRLATDGFGSFDTAMRDVVSISNDTRTRLSDTAALYGKVA